MADECTKESRSSCGCTNFKTHLQRICESSQRETHDDLNMFEHSPSEAASTYWVCLTRQTICNLLIVELKFVSDAFSFSKYTSHFRPGSTHCQIGFQLILCCAVDVVLLVSDWSIAHESV